MFGKMKALKILLVENELECIEIPDTIDGGEIKMVNICTLQEGIDYCIDNDDFDVILLDLNLPNGKGFDAFLKFKEACYHKPIIVISTDDSSALKCVKHGAQDYLLKPINSETLTRSIKYSIERYKLVMERESLFRSAPIGMGLLDYSRGQRIITYVNDRLCEMLGYSPDEIIGHSAKFIYPTQEEFERVGRIKYPLIEKSGIGTLETQWKTKNGKILDILLSSVYVNPTKTIGPLTFSGIDITETKNLQRELNKRIKEWQHTITSVGGLARLETLINGK